MDYDDWPDCPIEGCVYKCCLALDSIYCFHHTPGNKYVKLIKIDMRNLALIDELEPAK